MIEVIEKKKGNLKSDVKILVGIAKYTNAKDYILPQFYEMMEHCVEPVVGKENILVVGDHEDTHYKTELRDGVGTYSEDMLMDAREIIRKVAIASEYDFLMWQGLDALFQSGDDLRRMIKHNVEIVAPLIAARKDSGRAVARRFAWKNGKPTTRQRDIPSSELLATQGLVESGFPGADNMLVRKDCFNIPFSEGHKPWYERVADGEDNVCVEEEWVRRALEAGKKCYVDCGIKVWHCDEDGTARMFKDIEQPTEELSWV